MGSSRKPLHRAGLGAGFVPVLPRGLNALHDSRGDKHRKSRRWEMFRDTYSKSRPAGQRVQRDHTEITFPVRIHSCNILFLYEPVHSFRFKRLQADAMKKNTKPERQPRYL